MKKDIKCNSKKSAKKSSKVNNRRKIATSALMIFVMLSVTGVSFVLNNNCEQRARQVNDDTFNFVQLSEYDGSIKDKIPWNLTLVNAWNCIPDNFSVNLKTLEGDLQVDERVYPDLLDMFDAARAVGVYPLVGSAYRTNEKQQKLLDDRIKAYTSSFYSKSEAEILAKTWVAVPGTSEHQLGLALDINAESDKCACWSVYNWLAKNSYKYGFILRYPYNKVEITGVNYEPWHYRYVGKEVAEKIYMQGICLEEYYSTYELKEILCQAHFDKEH